MSESIAGTPRDLSGRRRFSTALGPGFAWACAIIVALVCAGILGYLLYQGWSSISLKFLTTDPNPSIIEGNAGGIRVPMVGTLLLVLLSTLVAFPIALGAAIYLAEYMDERSRLTRSIRLGLEVLASVPSVVFGMFGLALFTRPLFTFLSSSGAQGAKMAFGRSFLVAAVVMGVHVLPFVVKVAEEAIRSVPNAYRQGAAALGITKWRVTRKVVLPSASNGIATGVILGMGLAAGDTAIVWLTLGGTMTMAVDRWWSPLHYLAVLKGTGSTLTTFTYFSSPAGEGNAPQLAFAAALVLMLIVLGLNLAAVFIGRRASAQK